LAVGCVAVLLGMNGFEHVTHFADFGGRHMAEDVPIKMTMQRCQRACGRYSAALSIRPRQASEMMSCTPLSPRSARWRRNADHPDLSSLAPSQMPRISRKPSELTALATSSETLRTSPAQVRFMTMPSRLPFDPPVPPSLDLDVDLPVEVRHRARTYSRAPERLGDILHPPNRNPRQIHLD